MPTPKELLKQTVEATAKLFKESEQLKKVRRQIEISERAERAAISATVSGVTEPSEET